MITPSIIEEIEKAEAMLMSYVSRVTTGDTGGEGFLPLLFALHRSIARVGGMLEGQRLLDEMIQPDPPWAS